MSLVLTSPAWVGDTSIGPRRTGIGCPLGPSLCGAANIVVLGIVVSGAEVVEAPGVVLKVGIGLSGVVTVDGVSGATAELGGTIVVDDAGDAGAPKTDGVAVGVLTMGAWDGGITAAGAGGTTVAAAGVVTVAGVNGLTAGTGTATGAET